MRVYYVYMLASRQNGVLYVGITRDLKRRTSQHRAGMFSQFTARYLVKRLVWFEVHHDARTAIAREKQLKRWRRAWKIALIMENNKSWSDLFETL